MEGGCEGEGCEGRGCEGDVRGERSGGREGAGNATK